MSVTVYWSFFDDEWMRAQEPKEIRKEFYARNIHEKNLLMEFHKCPFVHDYLSNIFSLHSVYDYSFRIDGEKTISNMYDQNFFNNHLIIRSIEKKVFSFTQPYIFFTEEKSLNVTIPAFPYLENNNITKRCMPLTGTIDIGKYFRMIDFVFQLKDPYEDFIIEKDEIFAYAQFHTDKKIVLKEFYPSENLKKYHDSVRNANANKRKKFLNKEYYYSNFKLKKLILKEIKNNLV